MTAACVASEADLEHPFSLYSALQASLFSSVKWDQKGVGKEPTVFFLWWLKAACSRVAKEHLDQKEVENTH